MQAVKQGGVRAEINVTPLVDVVLVLLIIFMVVAPHLAITPNVALPETERPEQRGEDARRIVVGIERGGTLWIDTEQVSADRFQQRMQEIATHRSDWEVAIQGDARLTYGEVRQAMLAVESAGFSRVGLITKRLEDG